MDKKAYQKPTKWFFKGTDSKIIHKTFFIVIKLFLLYEKDNWEIKKTVKRIFVLKIRLPTCNY
jgi:hypothetical protein